MIGQVCFGGWRKDNACRNSLVEILEQIHVLCTNNCIKSAHSFNIAIYISARRRYRKHYRRKENAMPKHYRLWNACWKILSVKPGFLIV
jgi:hypothetical protein